MDQTPSKPPKSLLRKVGRAIADYRMIQDGDRILLGVSGAAVNAAWPLLISDHAPDGEQAAVAAGLNAVMGLRGLIVPFAVMAPVSAGYLDETGGLLLCAVAGLAVTAGVIAAARATGAKRRPPAA